MPESLDSRIPEPELMEETEQARAYAQADFDQPHDMFVDAFRQRFGPSLSGTVLDLGCGTADISCRFARAFPHINIHGIDGSAAMLTFARQTVEAQGLSSRIALFHMAIPVASLPQESYDGIIVNSLLHHLPRPEVMWQTIRQAGDPGTPVFVMDLIRPENKARARDIVETYSGNEPEVLKRDFYNSLLAAFRPDEVRDQLKREGMDFLKLEIVSDRHFIVWGHLQV